MNKNEHIIKVNVYTAMLICHLYKRNNLRGYLNTLPGWRSSSKMGSARKGNNLLLRVQRFFLKSWSPSLKTKEAINK